MNCDVCGKEVDQAKVWHPVFTVSKHGLGKDRVRGKYEEGVACCMQCAWQFSQHGKEAEQKKSLLFSEAKSGA